MNRIFAGLAVLSLSAIVFAETVNTPGLATQDDDNAPLMVAFADLKWTKLPERPGMMFAVLSGDPTKGNTHRCARCRPERTTRFIRTAVG